MTQLDTCLTGDQAAVLSANCQKIFMEIDCEIFSVVFLPL